MHLHAYGYYSTLTKKWIIKYPEYNDCTIISNCTIVILMNLLPILIKTDLCITK